MVAQPSDVKTRVVGSLPTLPAVGQKLLRMVAADDCKFGELNAVIRTDAGFSGEILRLANSAILASRFEVLSILHAISVLGIDRLRSLVLTISMRDMLRGSRRNAVLQLAWRHNFAAALACEAMGGPLGFDRAVAYTAGLLHELGRLALIGAFGPRYIEAFEIAQDTGGDLEAVERGMLGIDHMEAGRLLCESWSLPSKLEEAVCHPRPQPSGAFGLPGLVAAGCVVAERTGFSIVGPRQEWDPVAVRSLVPPDQWAAVEEIVAAMPDSIPQGVSRFEDEFLA
jgi:HD-like signal output (HDOD) protein